ncbi:protein SOSEKI 1 isoform X2 [Mercurialis annua]|uniref:protein SOSEKI 1 isoform X2 n=1 Tax=Mercurialis annua TaxID=3986 RepID=UPI002160640C|nr:protein SOSEKI 1 isoform X2 [Mercurialis annua]
MEGSTTGEVRRVHIIYFLSIMGHMEQPHLIRVHHLNRTGVYLRDMKRWMAELRGKQMPASFAWSYKRRYKSGYVWQDLMDDDLITPISDNEYVLKGSQISSYGEITENVKVGEENQVKSSSQTSPKASTKMSPLFSSEGDDKKKSKSYSKMVRNLVTCGAVDTNDNALLAFNKSTTQHNARPRFDQRNTKLNNPTCSQCGKRFKPEKLHMHMQSCKGMKASAKKKTHSMNQLISIS